MKRVVVIGASQAGLLAMKTLARQCPSSVSLSAHLISPNDFAYFNIASPRLLVQPELLHKVLFNIQDILKNLNHNSKDQFTFTQGSVSDINLDKRKIYLHKSLVPIEYDALIIASGNRMDSLAFKLSNIQSQHHTIREIQSLSKKIRSANSIAVIGGGTTGVEIAGELTNNRKFTKKVTLYTGQESPLAEFESCHRKKGIDRLNKLGVEIINNEMVKIIEDNTAVKLQDGTVKKYSVVIPAYRSIPNSEFLPSSVLSKRGYLDTDEYFRLKNYHEVIGLGDILDCGKKSSLDLFYAQKQVFEATVAHEIFEKKDIKLKKYEPVQTDKSFVVPIGRDGGVAAIWNIPLPKFVVKQFKAKDFLIPKAKLQMENNLGRFPLLEVPHQPRNWVNSLFHNNKLESHNSSGLHLWDVSVPRNCP
ncbi:uncharacterized protein J8A68_003343 [[Candida] subhashii]|uniref:FAD/NAD(P)-binding domain-containing protein n=1 Tax=[Candida] subhashii TaxID=561895 RepID=A0A8J5QMI4_9ASCO|nr:uncharacterized protein J8A68_003343 [[Candida] subhashii]KAG7663165.1 hypothetical protein J8A68_003343 [[Candida] subhashii]